MSYHNCIMIYTDYREGDMGTVDLSNLFHFSSTETINFATHCQSP